MLQSKPLPRPVQHEPSWREPLSPALQRHQSSFLTPVFLACLVLKSLQDYQGWQPQKCLEGTQNLPHVPLKMHKIPTFTSRVALSFPSPGRAGQWRFIASAPVELKTVNTGWALRHLHSTFHLAATTLVTFQELQVSPPESQATACAILHRTAPHI